MTDADGAAGTAGSEGPVDKSRKVYQLCQMLHDLRLTIYNDLCCITGSNNEQSIDAKSNSAVVD